MVKNLTKLQLLDGIRYYCYVQKLTKVEADV